MVQRHPTAAARAARPPAAGPAAVLLEAFRRYDTGESVDDLVAPEYRTVGDPTGFLPPHGERGDVRVAEVHEQHITFQLREVICQDERHALYHGVWVRRLPGGGGSAGRFWALATVLAGRIARVEYARDRAAAERLLAAAQRARAAEAVATA